MDVIEQYSLWPSNRTYAFFTKYPWYSVFMLYWYKSTNPDTAAAGYGA